MNILMLGGAKRVSVARKLLAAGARHIVDWELDPHVALAAVAEVEVAPRWSAPDIMQQLDSTVERHGIRAIIPFVDGAVSVAARYHRHNPAVYAPVGPNDEATAAMFDKVLADGIFRHAGLPVPDATGDDLIAKPRYGSASQGLLRISSPGEVDPQAYLVQRYIAHREEITVDCYVSVLSGAIKCISPRRRLEVAGGEVTATITVDDAEATELARRVLTGLELGGAVTVQLLRDLDSGTLYVMEVNPRLGGGVVCSCHAGCDIPAMILDEAAGREATAATPRPGTLIKRYLEETVFYV